MGMAAGAGSRQGCMLGFEACWELTLGGNKEPGRSVAELQLEAVSCTSGCWALSRGGPWETLWKEDLPYRDISGRDGFGVFQLGCWQGVFFPLGCGSGASLGLSDGGKGSVLVF